MKEPYVHHKHASSTCGLHTASLMTRAPTVSAVPHTSPKSKPNKVPEPPSGHRPGRSERSNGSRRRPMAHVPLRGPGARVPGQTDEHRTYHVDRRRAHHDAQLGSAGGLAVTWIRSPRARGSAPAGTYARDTAPRHPRHSSSHQHTAGYDLLIGRQGCQPLWPESRAGCEALDAPR